MAALGLFAEKMLLKSKGRDRETYQEAVVVMQTRGEWLGQPCNGGGEKYLGCGHI